MGAIAKPAGPVIPLANLPGRSLMALTGNWRAQSGDAEAWGNPSPAALEFADADWTPVEIPHLERATAERDTVWYRHRFTVDELPVDGRRSLLRFGGAFYHTRVWLNGETLGEHEGYFQPFAFDVTGRLQAGENLLAVACRFPVEAGRFKQKTAVAGIFADWDCKPYPTAFYPELDPICPWSVPAGLWQPVQLVVSGPILIESLNVYPALQVPFSWDPVARAAATRLRLFVSLRNLSQAVQTFPLQAAIAPFNFEESGGARHAETISLEAGEQRRHVLDLHLPGPRLWSPWTHGEPWLYQATVTLGDREPEVARQVFGVREIRAEIEPGRWAWWLNGRRIFPKGSNYIADFWLNRVKEAGLRRDLALARQANLDLLRVHAHIAPPDFYRLCDELGMLVFCDFPLIWTYAFQLPAEAEAEFQESVLQQAGEMVDLLGSHPSIVLWCLHNEPPWTEAGRFLGSDVHETKTNRAVD
jgi:beta-mannosidase